jgi:chemotaxis protein CheD
MTVTVLQKMLITQGELAVGDHPDQVISTLVGSCVSCCLWDPVAGVGGMNHMLLAVSTAGPDQSNFAGINAMELLINAILKKGGQRHRLQAKAFGGAKMVSGLSDIGKSNSDFTLDFLAREGIVCVGHSLGGTAARSLKFWPATGRVLQRISNEIPDEAPPQISPPTAGNELELF